MGERIDDARKRAGLSKSELARRCGKGRKARRMTGAELGTLLGVSQATVSKHERRDKPLPAKWLPRLADAGIRAIDP